MTLSKKAQKIYGEIGAHTKLGDLRNSAKEIKKDHELAMELWSTGELLPGLLAVLIMDPKELNADVVEQLFNDMERQPYDERLQLADWLLANQLTKNKKTLGLLTSWENNSSALKRRLFWYHEGRLRWVGQTPPGNTKQLLSTIEKKILQEEPEVQWAMNFAAKWIGVFDQPYREQCIKMGKKLGLYKDEVVAKNCSPEYLPAFIEMEVKKRNLA